MMTSLLSVCQRLMRSGVALKRIIVHYELNMSRNLYFQPHNKTSRRRLHRRNRIVMSYIKTYPILLRLPLRLPRMWLDRSFILAVLCYRHLPNILFNFTSYFHNSKFCTTVLAKYKLHSIYVTLYLYQMLFWTKCKWRFRRVINCAEGAGSCSVLQTIHLIITMLVAFLWHFMFCAPVRHYCDFTTL